MRRCPVCGAAHATCGPQIASRTRPVDLLGVIVSNEEPVQLFEYKTVTRGVESRVQLSEEDAQARRDAGEQIEQVGSIEVTNPPDNPASNETHGDQPQPETKARTAPNKARTAGGDK